MTRAPGPVDPLSDVVESDRSCRSCGYALRGLKKSSVCPECGMPIRSPAWIHDPITRVPSDAIRPLRLGGWLATAGILAMVAAVVLELSRAWRPGMAMLCFVAATLSWCAGMWLLTRASHLPQAAVHGLSPRGRLRLWARWLQSAWVGCGATATVLMLGLRTDLQLVLGLATVVFFVLGVVGLVLASIVLERLSEWARDDEAQKLFGAFAWGLPFAALFAVVGSVVATKLATPIIIVAGVIMLVAFAVFPYALFSLTRSLTYAVVHAEDHQDLEERRLQQRQRDADKVAARIRAADRV